MTKKGSESNIRVPEVPRILMEELRVKKLKCSRSVLARLLRISEKAVRSLEMPYDFNSFPLHKSLEKEAVVKAKRLYYLCCVVPPTMHATKDYNPLVLWLEQPNPTLHYARPIDLLDSEGGRRILKSFIEETGPKVEWPC